MRWLLVILGALAGSAPAEEIAETRELVGTVGSRTALLIAHARQRADGGWRITGEYLVLPTLQRRFLEGERGPQLGVTALKEGTSAILFGHDATGELRGIWREGSFSGMRYGPGGQERERFSFSERFPAMDDYGAAVRCEAKDGQYAYTLDYSFREGQVERFAWRSSVSPAEHRCVLPPLGPQPFEGGLRLAADGCQVTLRRVGDAVKVSAEGCAGHCGSQAWLEPVLVEGRSHCRLLRPEVR